MLANACFILILIDTPLNKLLILSVIKLSIFELVAIHVVLLRQMKRTLLVAFM